MEEVGIGNEPSERLNALTDKVIGSAVEVHRALGPGYLEGVHKEALAVKLQLRGLAFERQFRFDKSYKGHKVGEGRIDLLIETAIVVALRAVDTLSPIHQVQVISYLAALGLQVGLLLNFNVPVLKSGIRRIIHTATNSASSASLWFKS
jgi:GxxExxY protein